MLATKIWEKDSSGNEVRRLGLTIGGVANMPPELYEQANGYSNEYWGWGGEDDDFNYRLRSNTGIRMVETDSHDNWWAISHSRDDLNEINPRRLDLLWKWK